MKNINNNMDLISIIIPIYNGEKYIERCIRSLQDQTYKEYEIILINDGSTDKSESLCLSLKKDNPYIRYYYQDNEGAGAARNLGLRYALGKYIMFVDCDDYLHPAYIKELHSLILSTGAEIACCSYYKGSDVDREKFLAQKKEGNNKLFSRQEAIQSLFYRREIMGYPHCKLFSRGVVEKIFFRTDLRLGEDFQYVFDALCKAEKIAYQNKKMYFYFQNDNGITHTLTYADMKKAWYMIKEKLDIDLIKENDRLRNAVLSKLFILGLDYLIKMIDMELDVVFKEELQKFIKKNCMKIFKDDKCKISNRILAGSCKVSVKGTVKICYVIMKLNKRIGIQMKKAV